MPKSPESGPAKKPKFYYGWLIVWLSFATLGFHVVTRFSFGIFQVPLLEEFGWSRGLLSGAFSLSMAMYAFGAPFAGSLLEKKGPARHHALGFGDTRRHVHRVFLRVLSLASLRPVRPVRRLRPRAERLFHAQRHHAALVRQETRPRHGYSPLGHRNRHPHPGPSHRAAHRVGGLALHLHDLWAGRAVRRRAHRLPPHARRTRGRGPGAGRQPAAHARGDGESGRRPRGRGKGCAGGFLGR